MFDWTNPNSKVSPHFTVHEALWLPSWQVMHNPNAAQRQSILRMAEAMERVRDQLGGRPIRVHCWLRPAVADVPAPHKGQNYNAAIGGALHSQHLSGHAVDFSIAGWPCDEVRAALLPHLDRLGICMENLPGSNWVHVDLGAPRAGRRFFQP